MKKTSIFLFFFTVICFSKLSCMQNDKTLSPLETIAILKKSLQESRKRNHEFIMALEESRRKSHHTIDSISQEQLSHYFRLQKKIFTEDSSQHPVETTPLKCTQEIIEESSKRIRGIKTNLVEQEQESPEIFSYENELELQRLCSSELFAPSAVSNKPEETVSATATMFFV